MVIMRMLMNLLGLLSGVTSDQTCVDFMLQCSAKLDYSLKG